MEMKRMKLNDLFDFDYIEDDESVTIFSVLSDSDTFPLVNAFINEDNVTDLNEDYFIGNSADKYISPLLQRFYDKYHESSGFKTNLSVDLATKIYRRFGVKWKKIYDALLTEYSPLENYSMVEERTPDLTFDDTTNSKSEITSDRTTNATNSYKGFNADDPVVVNQTDGTDNVTTSGASEDNEIHKVSTQTGSETLTRSGNIGVTTSQQMLESEFKVREYDFYKMVYNDIDSVLCLSIY